jgi:hypothetical protein
MPDPGFGHPPDPAEIPRIEIGGEPERRIVAHRDHVGLVLEAEYRRQRSKVSSCDTSASGATLASTVGSKKVPPSEWRFPR